MAPAEDKWTGKSEIQFLSLMIGLNFHPSFDDSRFSGFYPLVNIQKAIENGDLYWIFPLKMVDLSILVVMLVYQRVINSFSAQVFSSLTQLTGGEMDSR